MLPSFMTKSFTRKRYPLASDHGTLSPDYTAEPATAEFFGSVQPGTGATDTINRNGAEVVKTIYAHPNADVSHLDLVDVNGKTYWVNGEPEEWDVGILDHVVIRLSRWLG
jgi:hypothetical protein